MFTSTFTFAKGEYDAEFHKLDATIADVARSTPGFIGEEAWENTETGLISNVYYWESEEAMYSLMNNRIHQMAKQAQARWLNGYQVVIAKVIGTRGDGKINHPLAGRTLNPSKE